MGHSGASSYDVEGDTDTVKVYLRGGWVYGSGLG